MSKLVWIAGAVFSINSKSKFGHKLIGSISKLKYLNNNESTEVLRIFYLKVSKPCIELSDSGRVIKIFFYSIGCHAFMSFTIIYWIRNSGVDNWMNFLNPIFLLCMYCSTANFSTFMAFSQTLQFKFKSIAKFTENNTKKSDNLKKDFVVIKKR